MGNTLRKQLQCIAASVGIVFCVSAGANETTYSLQSVLFDYATYGSVRIPDLDDDELAALESGEPVVLTSTDPADDAVNKFGVVGLRVIDSPRLLVWLTAMGVASEPDVRLTRAMLTQPTVGSYVRYQHVNLPWPMRDRHWVVHCAKNTDVAVASDGRFWEHRWQLVEAGEALLPAAVSDGRISGLSTKQMAKSVYLPANRGAWATVPLDTDKTLVIASFDGSLGGLFPDSMVRRFAKIHLRAGLNLVAELSLRAHLEYSDNRTIFDGYGKPISMEAVRQVAGSQGSLDPAAND